MNKIWKCLGATVDDRVAEGQPFFPTQKAGDPEREYPLTLQEGVPLGVDEPTLTFPELSPAKEELSGAPEKWEELASPTGRDSAEAFADSIKERHSLKREREMGLVERPFTKQEAAKMCGCHPSELCPGPMAAMMGRKGRLPVALTPDARVVRGISGIKKHNVLPFES